MPVRLRVADQDEPAAQTDARAYALAGTLVPQVAWDVVGGLSKPSKMPGYAYGLPAHRCITGSKLAQTEGTVCSDCYALKGRYVFANVQRAQERRFKAIRSPFWSAAMAALLWGRYGRAGVFRWHDSGDLQGVWHLEKIYQVARLVPEVRFWLPTREYGIVLRASDPPPNIVVRLSAHRIGEPVDIDSLASFNTSTVHETRGQPVPAPSGIQRESVECRAYTRNHECGPCRACWSPDVKNVSYPLH